jgi:uncharacterized cupin superfamily protein
MVNIDHAEFDEPREQDGFRARRARIGYALGMERLGASLWEIPPGEAAYPYHFHLADEEFVVVLAGRPTLRGPDGKRRLEPGEALSFRRGEEGAHQFLNETEEVVRFLAVSTSGEPDICVYPDSGKLGAAERRPDGSGLRKFFRVDDEVDYWEGESR